MPSDYMQNILFRYLNIAIKHWVNALLSWLLSVIVALHTRHDISNCSRLNTSLSITFGLLHRRTYLGAVEWSGDCNPDAIWSQSDQTRNTWNISRRWTPEECCAIWEQYHRKQAVTLLCLAIKLGRYFLHMGWYQQLIIAATLAVLLHALGTERRKGL